MTTGLRIGEATGLHWKDVDLEGYSLHVRDTVKRVKGESVMVGDTKTPHSRRRIELARSTVAALRAHEKRQEWERRTAGESWTKHGLVFCTLEGGPLDAGQ